MTPPQVIRMRRSCLRCLDESEQGGSRNGLGQLTWRLATWRLSLQGGRATGRA